MCFYVFRFCSRRYLDPPPQGTGGGVISLGILSDVSFSHCGYLDFLRFCTILDLKILWENNGNRNPVEKEMEMRVVRQNVDYQGGNPDFWDPLGRPSESRLILGRFPGDFE